MNTNQVYYHSAEDMKEIPDTSVHLIVTSPPSPAEITTAAADPVPVENEYEKMSKKAVYSLHPLDLIKAYNTDTINADAKYRTKIVRLRGIIRDIKMVSGFQSVLLSSGDMPEYVHCRIRLGQEASLKDYKKDKTYS